MAVMIEKIMAAKIQATKMVMLTIIVACIVYNIGLTHVFDRSGIMWDGPQWRWNWSLWWSIVKQIV